MAAIAGPAVLVVLLGCAPRSTDQAARSPANVGDADRARAVLEAALDAIGTPAEAAGARSIRVKRSGTRRWIGQGRTPGAAGRLPLEMEWLVDFSGGRVLRTQTTYQGGEVYFGFRLVYTPRELASVEYVTDLRAPSAGDPAAISAAQLRGFPEPRGTLLSALDRPETLRYLGQERLGGRSHHVVSYRDEAARGWRVYVDFESHLPRRIVSEEPVRMPLDTAFITTEFDEYRAVGRLAIPHLVRRSLPRPGTLGDVIEDVTRVVTLETNVGIDDATFTTPAGVAPRRPDAAPTIARPAEGVLFIENAVPNYNQLVVDVDAGLVVVDAPGSDETSRAVLDLLREAFPDRPVRYVVATHAHFDHLGGIAEYVAQGARVLTSAADRGFVEDLVLRSLAASGRADASVSVDAVSDVRVIGESARRVEVREVGPNRHALGLLAAFVPEHRLLFVADVVSADWGRLRPPIPETYGFAHRVRELGLDVEAFLPSHGPAIPSADFERALALAAASPSPPSGVDDGTPDGESPGPEIRRFAHGEASLESNSYLLASGGDAILVDVPRARSDAEALIGRLNAAGVRPGTIFLTQARPEHFLSLDRVASAFPTARVVSAPPVADRINRHAPGLVASASTQPGPEGPERYVPIDGLESDTLRIGPHVLRVVEWDGTTADGPVAALLLPGARLVAGDLAVHRAHPGLTVEDLEGWGSRLDRVAELDVDVVYPGHGPPTRMPSFLAEMRSYLGAFADASARLGSERLFEEMLFRYPDYVSRDLLGEALAGEGAGGALS